MPETLFGAGLRVPDRRGQRHDLCLHQPDRRPNHPAAVKDLEKLGIPEDVELDDSVTNIALFGLDTRGDSFEGNSDIMMIVSVDNRHKMVKLISILRDTKVDLEGSPHASMPPMPTEARTLPSIR